MKMKKIGVWLLLIAVILYMAFFIPIIFTESEPSIGFIRFSLALGFIGSILILIGVGKDRYKEKREEQENNDYRKY